MPDTLTLALPRRVLHGLAYLVFAASSIYFLLHNWVPSLTAMTHSYPAYYTASRLVIEGRWSAQVYDDKWFEARVLEMTEGRVSDRFSLHPPTTSLLLVPIAWLDIGTARVLWQGLNLGLLLLALWLTFDALQVTDLVWRAAFTAFAFLFPPVAENVRVGQVYIFVLFLYALALHGELRRNQMRAGLGLGGAAGLKLSGAPLWLVLVVRRQWRTLFWAALIAVLSGIAGLALLGWGGWWAFFLRLASTLQPPPLSAHVAFQTTPSFLQRMFVGSPEFNPTPLFDVPWLAGIMNLAIMSAALGLTLWNGRRAPLRLAFASAVTLSVILFPQAIEYHYTLLLIPLAVVFFGLLDAPTRWAIGWFLLILIFLYVPFDWNDARWSAPGMILLAYPRLYGGWLLWLLLLDRMRQSHPARVVAEQTA